MSTQHARIPKSLHYLLEHCLQYGFGKLAEERHRRNKERNDWPDMWGEHAERGIFESPSLLFARKPGYIDLEESPSMSYEKARGVFCLGLKWLTVVSGPRLLKYLTSEMEHLTELEISQIAGYTVYLCRKQASLGVSELAKEQLLSFEDVVVCILMKSDAERERALALRGRSLHGGPLQARAGSALYNRLKLGHAELMELPLGKRYEFYLRSPVQPCQDCCVRNCCNFRRRLQHGQLAKLQSEDRMAVFVDWADMDESDTLLWVADHENCCASRLICYGYRSRWRSDLMCMLEQLPLVRELVLTDRKGDWDLYLEMSDLWEDLYCRHSFLHDIIFEDGAIMCSIRLGADCEPGQR